MAFYLTLSLYFFGRRQIFLAAGMLTLGLGMKTGIYALFPAFLGCIQWQFGLDELVVVVFIIISY